MCIRVSCVEGRMVDSVLSVVFETTERILARKVKLLSAMWLDEDSTITNRSKTNTQANCQADAIKNIKRIWEVINRRLQISTVKTRREDNLTLNGKRIDMNIELKSALQMVSLLEKYRSGIHEKDLVRYLLLRGGLSMIIVEDYPFEELSEATLKLATAMNMVQLLEENLEHIVGKDLDRYMELRGVLDHLYYVDLVDLPGSIVDVTKQKEAGHAII